MPLTLVLGPANSAKAGEVLGAFGALAARGAVLVVPTVADAHHYRRELADQGAVLGSVVTFSGLAGEVARRAGYAQRRLSALQRDHVLREVVAGARLEALHRSAAAPGFRHALGALIAELTRSLTGPEQFAVALRVWSAEDKRRAAYAGDLAHLYEHYAAELSRRGMVDAELFAWRALDALRAAPARWGTDQVFFYGFDDLTPLERDAVETLSRRAGVRVTVSLTYEAGRAAVQARAEVVAELRPLADDVRELEALDEHYAPTARRGLHHLERALFELDAHRIDPGPAVGLLEAGGERAEAELVAREVLALVRSGISAEEIAVVYRSVARIGPLVAQVFDQYDIPLATGFSLRFVHTPLGRALRGAVRCALGAERAGADDLLAYLRAPGRLPDPAAADRLEADLRRDGERTVAAARHRLGDELPELDALAAALEPAVAVAALARELFAAPHRGQAPTLTRVESVDARALSTLLRALDELAEIGHRPSAPELLELLDELTVAASSAPQTGEVLLAEPLQIRARRYRAVFVCGLQEGAFPRPASPEPFLSDERRREIALCSGLRLRPHEDDLDRERYLLYATVSRATERVVFSYRSSDEEGNLALASPFVGDVTAVFPPDWPQRRRRRLLADVVWAAGTAPTVREHARAVAAAAAPAAGEQPEPDRQLSRLALDRLRHTEILSAGALEAYSECPVRWLIERELRPEPLEPESEPITRGNLMHGVLERLLRRLDGPVTPGNLRDAEALATGLLAELAAGPGAKLGAGAPPVVRAGILRAIEADLRRYLEYDAAQGTAWRPFGVELRFGFDVTPRTGEDAYQDGVGEADSRIASLPPLALGSGPDRVLIRGMIDRVDVDGGGHAIVRDYKSGNPRPQWAVARWATDRQLQVALYMVVVRELTDLDPVAGFYQPLRGDDLRGRGLFIKDNELGPAHPRDGRPTDEFEAVLQDATERAVTVAAALRAGHLTPCPQTCSRDGCQFPEICRSQ